MSEKRSAEEAQYSRALRDFEGQAIQYANRFIKDARVRIIYIEKVKHYSKMVRQCYDLGR
ncbi:MAG: hypothetical protein WBD27_10820 [Pyrinomonadaceae bacterium]